MEKVTIGEFAELCRARGPEVLQLYVELMRDSKTPGMVKIKAGEAILRYGYDKLLQYTMEKLADLELDTLTPEARIELFKKAIVEEEKKIAEELGQIS